MFLLSFLRNLFYDPASHVSQLFEHVSSYESPVPFVFYFPIAQPTQPPPSSELLFPQEVFFLSVPGGHAQVKQGPEVTFF